MSEARPAIAVLTPIHGPALEALEARWTVHRAFGDGAADAATLAGVPVAVTTGLRGFGPDDLRALPAVRLVAVFGVGHGTLDLEAAAAAGVQVTTTPDATHATVAELAVGLLLAVTRRIAEADRWVRAGRWPDGGFGLGRGLAGRTVGLLGLGRIGRGVAARLAGFDVELRYTARTRRPDVPWPFEPDVRALARASDALIVACPATPETERLVDAAVLEALGPDGVLVNVARGSIVDEDALVEALRTGRIAGAGLDVHRDEPHVHPALPGLDNVVLLPHLGTSTREIRAQRTERLLATVEAFFDGRPLEDAVRR